MSKLKKIDFKKNIKIFYQFLEFLGKHVFLTALILIFSALFLGGLVFYKYSVLAKEKIPELPEKPFNFEEKNFQEVMNILEMRQKKFEESESKLYPNPFK